MKTILTIIIIGIGIATTCFSCKKNVESFPVAFDMQSQFDNDNVNVYVDNVLVFGNVITTNNALSLAASAQKTLREGDHEIKVFVNNNVMTEKFNLDKDLYLGINYNRNTQKISVIFSATRFVYD